MSDTQDKDVPATASAVPKAVPKQLTPWKPGQSGNPKGRAKGSRNKLGEDFVKALQESFEAHGPETIEIVRTERPQEYLKVVASILPKELHVKTDALEELTDDDLVNQLDAIRSLLASGHFAQIGKRSEEASRH